MGLQPSAGIQSPVCDPKNADCPPASPLPGQCVCPCDLGSVVSKDVLSSLSSQQLFLFFGCGYPVGVDLHFPKTLWSPGARASLAMLESSAPVLEIKPESVTFGPQQLVHCTFMEGIVYGFRRI